MACGFATIAVACLMALQLTQRWQTWDFLPSQILQAVGQSSALIALVLFAVRTVTPAAVFTFGALLQTARLLGGEIGNAFMQTFVRMAEQTESYLDGLHVQEGFSRVQHWLDTTGAVLRLRGATASNVPDQSLAVLADTIRTQANVLSIIDGFAACVVASIIGLCLIAMLRQP